MRVAIDLGTFYLLVIVFEPSPLGIAVHVVLAHFMSFSWLCCLYCRWHWHWAKRVDESCEKQHVSATAQLKMKQPKIRRAFSSNEFSKSRLFKFGICWPRPAHA